MSKKEQALLSLADRILSRMMDDVAMDIAVQTHREIRRAKAPCPVCHTHCSSGHPSGAASGAEDVPDGGGASNGKGDSSILLECMVCKRQIASNRYAPHLSQCLGMGARKGSSRAATTKAAPEPARSASPFIGSEAGTMSDDLPAGKGKGKSKTKRVDDAEFNLHRKKSPVTSPAKKSQRNKPSAPRSISRVPSKLRESSIASLAEPTQEAHAYSPGSRDSSPEESFETPTPTTRSAHSPKGPAGPKRKGGALPAYSPPSAPARVSELDYLVDVEGEETGSSTDTSDSS